MNEACKSEIARIRAQIEAEYQAAKLAMEGPRFGTARHDFINARQERIGVLQQELEQLVSNQAVVLVAQTLQALPEATSAPDTLADVSEGAVGSEAKEQQ